MKLIHWALAVVRLGDRRAEVEADLNELFEMRSQTRGRAYAVRRLIVDVFSVTRSPRRGSFGQDFRFGFRLIRKHPAPVGITVAGLALAIAVVTAAFGVVNAVLLRPFGVDDPSSTVSISRPGPRPVAWWHYNQFVELQKRLQRVNVEASLLDSARFSLSAAGEDGSLENLQFVSAGYLPLFGGRARFGRSLDRRDNAEGAPAVAVVSHRFWTTRLGSDESIVGKTVWIGESPVTIVGVMQPEFEGLQRFTVSLWAPLAAHDDMTHSRPLSPTSTDLVTVAGRLASGASIAAAQNELAAVTRSSVDSQGKPDNEMRGARVVSSRSPWAAGDPENNYPAIAMIGLAGLVLLLACANAANLLLAGAASRMREMGIRLALGATRARIIRQLISESLLLGAVSGLFGFLLAIWLMKLAIAVLPLPPSLNASPDFRVLIFAVATAIVSGIGAGLAPARFGANGDVVAAVKVQSGGHGQASRQSRLRLSFVGVQAGVSVFLLIAASLLTRSAIHLNGASLGFDADKLWSVELEIPRSASLYDRVTQRYNANALAYLQAAAAAVRALPSVENTSLSHYGPESSSRSPVEPTASDGRSVAAFQLNGDAAYFSTGGFRIVQGRGFSEEEAASGPHVALISESVAHDLFGNADPIGQTISGVRNPDNKYTDAVVIGVVADAMTHRSESGRQGNIYVPIGRQFSGPPELLVRTARTSQMAREVERALLAVDPRVRPTAVSIGARILRRNDDARTMATLAASVAGLACVLAILGLYGVTAFVLAQRTQEIGIRLTLGATGGEILAMLMRQSLRPALIGLAVGLMAALGATQIISSMLSGIGPRDPIAIAFATATLLTGAFAAVIGPAQLAARIDPASVLRQQ